MPPTETLLPDINTPITIAFDNPPGTTAVGTDDHVTDCEVPVGVTLAKDVPVPEFLDLYVSPEVNQPIQQFQPCGIPLV